MEENESDESRGCKLVLINIINKIYSFQSFYSFYSFFVLELKTEEVYGFVFWVTSWVAFLLYILWSFLPDNIINNDIGITYLPDK